MDWDIVEAKYLEGFKIKLKFNDGKVGTLDLENKLVGKIFEPLKNPEFFQKFSIHPEIKILIWENGADVAPEFAYANAK